MAEREDTELRPVVVDGTPTRWGANPPSKLGRTFGGLLAFLAVWQIVSPEDVIGTIIGWIALGVSVLWFVPCSTYLRVLVTAAFFAGCVVAIRLF
jgi:hypothetical protein